MSVFSIVCSAFKHAKGLALKKFNVFVNILFAEDSELSVSESPIVTGFLLR
jgi:hypothetical protein